MPDAGRMGGGTKREPRERRVAGISTENDDTPGAIPRRRETNPHKPDARSGATGSARNAPPESEPDSTGSTIPTKRAEGSERPGKE